MKLELRMLKLPSNFVFGNALKNAYAFFSIRLTDNYKKQTTKHIKENSSFPFICFSAVHKIIFYSVCTTFLLSCSAYSEVFYASLAPVPIAPRSSAPVPKAPPPKSPDITKVIPKQTLPKVSNPIVPISNVTTNKTVEIKVSTPPAVDSLAPARPILAPINPVQMDPLKEVTVEAPELPKQQDIVATNNSDANKISFDYVLKKALDNSFELKISNVDVGISRALVKEAKSAYFPVLKTDFYSEYAHDMTDGTRTLSSVGNSIVNTNTKYQDLANLSISYNLYDFGVRGRKLSIAKKDVNAKRLIYDQIFRDLKLNIVDLYTNALLTYKDLKSRKEIYPIYKQLFNIKQQLYQAGSTSKIDIADEAIKMARVSDEISTLQSKLKMILRDISFYTQEKYDMDSLELSDFPEQAETYISNVNLEKTPGKETYKLGVIKKEAALNIDTVDFEKTPDYAIYQLEIEKKKAELQILKRQRLPSIGMYSSYSFYGYDKNSFIDSVQDLSDRNLSVGFSASMTPFDGFKTSANIKKVELEIERLKLERDRKMAELKNNYDKINESALFYDGQLINKEELLSKIQDKLLMLERLTQQSLIDKTYSLNQKAELIQQKTELEKTIINRIAAIKKLNIFSENIDE